MIGKNKESHYTARLEDVLFIHNEYETLLQFQMSKFSLNVQKTCIFGFGYGKFMLISKLP